MRFHKYFFGDMPTSPDLCAVVKSSETDVLLEKLLNAAAGSIKSKDFAVGKDLINAGILRADEFGSLYFACPVFSADDEAVLRRLTCESAEIIAGKIEKCKDRLYEAVNGIDDRYTPDVHIYHLLCGAVFDGCFFDRLAEAGVLTVSKIQKNGEDYLPVIYEDAPSLNKLSAGILCSYNRLSAGRGTFVSFGDAAGKRHDFFRWYRDAVNGKVSFQTEVDIIREKQTLTEMFARAYNGEAIPEKYIYVFEKIGYMKNGRICVPVYSKEIMCDVVKKLDAIAAEAVMDEMAASLREVASASGLTAVRHGVPVADIANEVYHLMFGQINEELVKRGIAAAPEYHPGQGRYLKSFEIK